VLSYRRLDSFWAAGIQFPDPLRKALDVFLVKYRPALSRSFSATRPRLTISQALGLGLFQRFGLHQEPLPLVPFSCTAPFQYYRNQSRVFSRTPGESCAPRGQKG
jgi:hypothetical protein